jgi:hypothetical protein
MGSGSVVLAWSVCLAARVLSLTPGQMPTIVCPMATECCPDGEVTMVNSVRLGHERPYCTGCGSPLDIDDGSYMEAE